MGDEQPGTNDDFQALYEFFSARRGDGEFFRRLYLLADRLRNVAALEQAADEGNHRVQLTRAQLRELEAKLAEVRSHVDEARLRVEIVQTIDEAHARAGEIVAEAEQRARGILEAAGRDARQVESALHARIAVKQGEHDALHQGIADAKGAIKTSIGASERLRR